MFEVKGILPGELAVQDPQLIFSMLEQENESEEYSGGNPYLNIFYGK